MKSNRHYFFMLLVILTVMGLVGCTENKGIKESKEDNSPVTIKVAWWGKDVRHERTLAAIDMFQNKYPTIKVEPIYMDFNEYFLQMAILTADQQIPDVIQMDYNHIAQYTERKLIVSLDTYLENGIIQRGEIDDAYLSGGMINEQLYGIPLGTNAASMAYNPALFDQAGIPYPTAESTYDDIMQMARDLKANINKEGFYPLANNVAHEFPYYLRQNGAAMFNAEGNSLGYTEDKYFVEYMNMQKAWKQEGLIGSDGAALFQEEGAALISQWSNQTANLVKEGVVKILPLPSIAGGEEGNYIRPATFFSVTSYSKHQEAAARFVDFITNDVEANKVLLGERGVPISAKVREEIMPLISDNDKVQYEYIEYVQKHSRDIDPPAPNAGSKVLSVLKRYEGKVLNGELIVEEAAKQFREEANKILAAG